MSTATAVTEILLQVFAHFIRHQICLNMRIADVNDIDLSAFHNRVITV
ncbi:hypothetical protein [Flavobacterium sp. 3HN19-14]